MFKWHLWGEKISIFYNGSFEVLMYHYLWTLKCKYMYSVTSLFCQSIIQCNQCKSVSASVVIHINETEEQFLSIQDWILIYSANININISFIGNKILLGYILITSLWQWYIADSPTLQRLFRADVREVMVVLGILEIHTSFGATGGYTSSFLGQ